MLRLASKNIQVSYFNCVRHKRKTDITKQLFNDFCVFAVQVLSFPFPSTPLESWPVVGERTTRHTCGMLLTELLSLCFTV